MAVNRLTPGRLVFNIVNTIILVFLAVITIYPFLYVIASSLSDHTFIIQGKVGIIPQGFTIEVYKRVFDYPMIGISYRNTVFYTLFGTVINMVLTICGAYPLSRDRFPGKNFFMFMVAFTMLFYGGMIPNFLVVKSLKMYNTIWAILIPGAISTWNLIIMRTFFKQIPVSLEESARIDGANEIQALLKVILPLSVPSLVTIALFYAVAHWNSFFSAMIYLRDRNLYPLQMILRQIVISEQTDEMLQDIAEGKDMISESVKHATIVVATLPILLVYPFIQKYFVKGVMIGAIKG